MPNLMLAAMLILAATVPACVADAPPRMELALDTAVPVGHALVIWVDGVGIDKFDQLQRAGKLPNITKYLISRGVTVRGAVASFPTITYANNVSFNTGLFPGHHGIVGNKWFDPYSLIFQNYSLIKTYQQVDEDFRAPTIHELLAGDYTATILTPVRRGATRKIDNWASAGVSWYFGLHANVNRLTTARFELIADIANRTGRWPTFILAYFVTPDTLGHAHGVTAAPYTEMILDVDRQVGHICRAMERARLLETTYITLISDHGFVNTPNHFSVADFFRKRLRLPTCSKMYGREALFEKRLDHFNRARVVVVAGGNRRCSIHLRPGRHWWQRPTEEQIDEFHRAHSPERPAGGDQAGRDNLPSLLAELPATQLVIVRRGPGSVRVQAAAGAGVIDRIVRAGEKLYRYRVLRGTDPLGHSAVAEAAALIDGEYHDADAWLGASLNTPHPDAVVQLLELSDSPRSGDIMLFANEEWDFINRDAGGHGGLLRREIVVPWIWAGPGLPANTSIEAARTVDLMPTILHLIGRAEAIPAGLDGHSIADRLKAARGRGQE